MTTMLQFMASRQRAILNGELGHSRIIYAKFQKGHKFECQGVAKAQSRANPSDPFCYDRVMSHLMQGITLRGDYLMEWGRRREIGLLSGLVKHPLASVLPEIVVQIPINRKIPTYC